MVSESKDNVGICSACIEEGDASAGEVRLHFSRGLCRKHFMRRYHAERRQAIRDRGVTPCSKCGTTGGAHRAGTAVPIRYAGDLCQSCRWPDNERQRLRRARREAELAEGPRRRNPLAFGRETTPEPDEAEREHEAVAILAELAVASLEAEVRRRWGPPEVTAEEAARDAVRDYISTAIGRALFAAAGGAA
jgi:hypothetical protein